MSGPRLFCSSLAITATQSDPNRDHLQEAWHLCATLLSIGRPYPLSQLASRCTLFPASPDLIKFLCSIPNSPISLLSHSFVTLSSHSLSALSSYMSSLGLTMDDLVPQIRGFLNSSSRKRKRDGFQCPSESEEEDDRGVISVPKRMPCNTEEVHYYLTDFFRRNTNTQARDVSTVLNHSMVELLTDFESRAVHLRCDSVAPELTHNENHTNAGLQTRDNRQLMARELNSLSCPPTRISDNERDPWSGPPTKVFNIVAVSSADANSMHLTDESKQETVSLIDVGNVNPIEVGVVNLLEVRDTHLLEVGDSGQLEVGDSGQLEVGDFNLLESGDVNLLEAGDFNPPEVDINPLGFEDFKLLEVGDLNLLELGNVNSLEVGDVNVSCEATHTRIAENKTIKEHGADEKLIEHCGLKGGMQNLFPPSNTLTSCIAPDTEFEGIDIVEDTANVPSLSNNSPKQKTPANSKPLSRSSARTMGTLRAEGAGSKGQDLYRSVGDHSKAIGASPDKQCFKRNQMLLSRAHKSKHNPNNMHLEDRKGQFTSFSSRDPSKRKKFPDFESYAVEEEEGSGGYGTVYRAQRKSGGIMVAIKCPHADAHKHHVSNELRMLERFGGKSFVIKYEGCFKNGNSDCLVLEHVEHDRPEVLKREIDVLQLQWYGYCMFRALASLHKQGVVHRDIKPGNFLFSRKTNKGYLIDFNLAVDLHQKYQISNKSKAASDLGSKHFTSQNDKFELPSTSKMHLTTKSSNTINNKTNKSSQSTLAPNSLKKAVGKIKAHKELRRWSQFNSQGADGSGVTSAKNGTSTRNNPSGERLREPLPCHGRKELINFLQETMTSPNNEGSKVPSSMRKRVAALPGKVEKELLCPTPMPLRTNSWPVAGAGLMNKGNVNRKKEGHCAGTKGFRAPEVCFRSSFQGPKIDIWSAGVTLLYLIIGRTPFTGEPEQNIKEIAKLRGSEDLWEVAKLHNCESSFPEELYDTRYLPSTDLREWCRINTKRKDMVEVIPRSLFDLIDKCLTVNPRLRISAEDALKHDFFAPIHGCLKKQRCQTENISRSFKVSNGQS